MATFRSYDTGIFKNDMVFGYTPSTTSSFIGNYQNSSLIFKTNNLDRIFISSSGNIGINKLAPNAQLDINGNSIITGSLIVTNGITGSLLGTATTASFVTASNVYGPYNANSVISSSHAVSSSRAVSSSYALTASYVLNGGGGGSTTPGGSNTSIQFNDSNAFSGSGNFTFNKTTNVVNLTGSLNISGSVTMSSAAGNIIFTDSATAKRGIQGTVGANDQWFVGGGATGTDAGYLEIATGDTGNDPLYASQYSSSPLVGTLTRRATILDASGNTSFPGNLTVTGSLKINTSTSLTGSLNISGSTVLTGSMRGQVINITAAANTASINASAGNFFTLSLINATNYHISASNIQPGQTINLRVSQSALGTGTVTFHSAIKQPSGSAYIATTTASAVDIISFVSFDSTALYSTSIKRLI